MRFLLLITLAVLLAGCASPGAPGLTGSANYQRCASQCEPGNAGNGTFCVDGCRVQEAEDSKNTAWCDALDNKADRPSCYGIVAKSVGDIKVCNKLPEGTDRNYCVSIFGT